MIRFVVGDTKPDLRFRIRQGNKAATLPVGTTIVFKVKKPNATIVTVNLVQTDATKQIWSGNFGVGDLDASSTEPLPGEIVVTFPGGLKQHSEQPYQVLVRSEFGVSTL